MAEKRADDIKSENRAADAIFLFVLAVGVIFMVAIPALLAVGGWLLVRERISRRDGVVVAISAVVLLVMAMVLGHGAAMSAYFHWLGVLVTGKGGSRLDIPFLPIILLAGVMLGTASSLQGTQVAIWGLKPFKKSQLTNAKGSLIPSKRDMQKMAVAKPPSESLVIHADTHSAHDPTPPGQRQFPIGVGPDRKAVLLSEAEINTHMLVFGATGAGKTVTLEVIAAGLCDLGWSGVVLDLKEDTKPGGLRDWCMEYAHSHAVLYQELRLSNPDSDFFFNPLEGIGPDEARDSILSLLEFEAPYWEAINKKQLGQTCTLFWSAYEVDPVQFPTPSAFDIGKLLSAADLPAAAKRMSAVVLTHLGDRYTRDDFSALLSPSKDEAMAASGLGARLTGVYATSAGRSVLRPSKTEGYRRSLDVTQDGLTYIGLDSLGKQDLTKMVSSSVLQRLSVDASVRTTGGSGTVRPRFVIIDEANWVDRTIIQNLLSRARSAGIAIILSTQGPKDWESHGRTGVPGFEALAQNCNVAVIMAQGELANAEMCADHIGLERQQQFSQQVREGALSDAGSLSEVRDYIISPDELRKLTIGQAIVKVSKPENRVSWVKIIPRDAKLKPRH